MAFIAGFISTLVFHQPVLTLFYLAGFISRVPYDLRPVPPLGIPAVISLAFWGGLWGIAIWPWLKKVDGPAYWARALVISAVFPTMVGLFIVFPLKGMPMAGGWNPKVIVSALVVDAVWGLGTAFLMRFMKPGSGLEKGQSIPFPGEVRSRRAALPQLRTLKAAKPPRH